MTPRTRLPEFRTPDPEIAAALVFEARRLRSRAFRAMALGLIGAVRQGAATLRRRVFALRHAAPQGGAGRAKTA
jgi:hypothetical protein